MIDVIVFGLFGKFVSIIVVGGVMFINFIVVLV